MPARSVTVTANFETVSTTNSYTVTVSGARGATGSGTYTAGLTVNITAGTDSTGQRFLNWTTTSDDVNFRNAYSPETSFPMPANNVAVTAVFDNAPTYTATVSSAGTGATGSGNYVEGKVVNITAGTAPTGQRFKNWTTSNSSVTFADADNAATTFKMPASAVTVTAVFETVYTATVSGGETWALGSGTYAVGATVSITAGTAPAGKIFKNWTTSSSGVTFANANNASTSFTMPSHDVTVTANYTTAFTDARDGKVYKTTTIGGKTWMAENLNYPPPSGNSWCYDGNADNCAKYGRLYDWSTANAVCPTGWHLPSRDDWGNLVNAAGGTDNYGTSGMVGKKLKAASGWNNNGNGTDDYGFSALPGGYRRYNGIFNSAGNGGVWWTATESGNDYALLRHIYNYDDIVDEYDDFKDNGFSVRCVKN